MANAQRPPPVDHLNRIAVLGNHLPRHCGIATFTTHIADALSAAAPLADTLVIAVNDAGRTHAYPPRVRCEITEGDLASYRRAADFLNVNRVDVLSVQHEYGIFGGQAGAHVLALLADVRMPIVTTLHTILSEPNDAQRAVLDELVRLSSRLVVMSRTGADLLMRVHGVNASQIDLIPHGIPDVPPAGGSKMRLGVDGKTVILTFGLLSPDKGIEYVIDAMPAILDAHPGTVYIVLGATHPHVVERDGDAYRLMLQARAASLGVAESIIFHDRFVTQDELVEFLSATDIYITPYLNPEQITSGTLAYAVGAGKAVISTPYIYARELLAGGRGVLVPWRDAGAIAHEVTTLIGDGDARAAMQARASTHGLAMAWPAVAAAYIDSFDRARAAFERRPRIAARTQVPARRPMALPEMDLRHVMAMTDDTGMLQHAVFNIPRYDEGYCLDDNARALLLVTMLEASRSGDPAALAAYSARYLAFVNHAFDRTSGRFRNFMSYSRAWTEPHGSEDSHGRALWALGTASAHAAQAGRVSLARDLFASALPPALTFSSPRAWAYALLGIHEYVRAVPGDEPVEGACELLGARLFDLFERSRGHDWPWFEDSVTYCNARMPQALIAAGTHLQRPDMVAAGLESLAWLVSVQASPEGHFAAIGSDGFYSRGETPASFDQQPVEACATASACLEAFRLTHDPKWLDHARCAFNWFLGQNHLRLWPYDASTGGCRDGLHHDRMNMNQGAESTLSFLMALREMRASEPIAHELPLFALEAVS